jgi:hypothetical protein
MSAFVVWGEFRQQIFLTRSREVAKKKALYGESAPSLEEDSLATGFGPLRIPRVFRSFA